jgi:hypothetical protein
MGALVMRHYEFDRIVALSPVTNAVLKNCIDLAQSQENLQEIEVLRNIGTQSLKRSLERMDVHIFVDDPLLFINDLFKTDSLRKNFDENSFCKDMKWIADRLISKQAKKIQTTAMTWVFDYPERHLSSYVGIDLPLDRQQRSRQISTAIEYLSLNRAIPDDSLDDAVSVSLLYGLDEGWKQMNKEIIHETESYFVQLNTKFPLHDEFREKALQINERKASNLEGPSERMVLVDGVLEMLKVLASTSHRNTQQFASHFKHMLDLTLETSTTLLDAAASGKITSHQSETVMAELTRVKALLSKQSDEIAIKNSLLEALIATRNKFDE